MAGCLSELVSPTTELDDFNGRLLGFYYDQLPKAYIRVCMYLQYHQNIRPSNGLTKDKEHSRIVEVESQKS